MPSRSIRPGFPFACWAVARYCRPESTEAAAGVEVAGEAVVPGVKTNCLPPAPRTGDDDVDFHLAAAVDTGHIGARPGVGAGGADCLGAGRDNNGLAFGQDVAPQQRQEAPRVASRTIEVGWRIRGAGRRLEESYQATAPGAATLAVAARPAMSAGATMQGFLEFSEHLHGQGVKSKFGVSVTLPPSP
jgi:hypothetical protein